MADDLKAMILAAGLGTRLRPHTDRYPKALYPVAGRPMILYPLLWLKRQGFGDVLINTFYLAEEIESALGDGSALGIRLRYSREETLLGTGGGIGRGRSLLGRHPMIVLNADTIVDVDLARLLERRRAAGGLATLALAAERNPGAYTQILVDDRERVRSIGGRPEPGAGNFRAANFTGLSILEPELTDLFPGDRPACLVRDGLIPALERGAGIAAYFHSGYWKPMDDVRRVEEAEEDLRAGLLPWMTEARD